MIPPVPRASGHPDCVPALPLPLQHAVDSADDVPPSCPPSPSISSSSSSSSSTARSIPFLPFFFPPLPPTTTRRWTPSPGAPSRIVSPCSSGRGGGATPGAPLQIASPCSPGRGGGAPPSVLSRIASPCSSGRGGGGIFLHPVANCQPLLLRERGGEHLLAPGCELTINL